MFRNKKTDKSTAKKNPADEIPLVGVRHQGATAGATPPGAAATAAPVNYGNVPYRRQEVSALEEKFGVRKIQGQISALMDKNVARRGYRVDDAIDSVVVQMTGGLKAEQPAAQRALKPQAAARDYGPYRRAEMAALEQRFGGHTIAAMYDDLTHNKFSEEGDVERPSHATNDAIDLLIQRMTRDEGNTWAKPNKKGSSAKADKAAVPAATGTSASGGTGIRAGMAAATTAAIAPSQWPQEADVRQLEEMYGQARSREMRQDLHNQGYTPAAAVEKLLRQRANRFSNEPSASPRSQSRPQSRPQDGMSLAPADPEKVSLFKKLFHQGRGGGDSPR